MDGTEQEPTENPNRRPQDGRGHYVRTLDSAKRDAAAAELRGQGRPYQQIADDLGYGNRGNAWRAVQNARADVARAPVAKLVQIETEQLDELYARALEILDTTHITVQQGRVVTMLDRETNTEVPIPDSGPKLAALNVAVKIRESYRNLLGLNAEKKINLSGGVRYEIVGINPTDIA